MEPREPRVYVVNYAGHDFADAERFGEIYYLTKGYVSFGHFDRIKYQMADALADSRFDDWLLPSGVPFLSIIAVIIFFHEHKRVNLLIWDNKKKRYNELVLHQKGLSDLLAVINGDDDAAGERDKSTG